MAEIFSDENFNCRGPIAPIDVLNLAKDIAVNGLDSPITVQPWTGKPGMKYRIVAGHRRHLAFRVNQATEIPAFIRELSELDAHLLNLRENLHREELNILQEAKALKYFLDYKLPNSNRPLFTEEELAGTFKTSRGWVQVRKDLLGLPKEIQEEAASGTLTQSQIKQLARIKDKQKQFALVRKIKEAKQRGEKVRLSNSVTNPADILRPKERDVHEIREMNGIIYDTLGPSLITRFAAWAAGDIATAALYGDLQKHCKENDIPFQMPAFVSQAISGVVLPKTDPVVS